MTDPNLSDINWTGPAADIRDDLVDIWFARHPFRDRDDGEALAESEAWADDLFAKHAQPRVDAKHARMTAALEDILARLDSEAHDAEIVSMYFRRNAEHATANKYEANAEALRCIVKTMGDNT